MSSHPRLIDGTSSPQSIFLTTTSAKHRIGTRGELEDGRVYYYGSHIAASAITIGLCVQHPAAIAAHVTQNSVPTGTATVNTSDAPKTISVTLGATLAHVNQYQGGMLKIEAATTGAGQCWFIDSHPAVDASGTLTFSTHDPVLTAVTGAGTTWSLVSNPWGSIVVTPAALTGMGCGVVPCDWPAATATAPVYGWVQTWGLASVFKDNSTLVVGSSVVHECADASLGSISVATAAGIAGRTGVAMEGLATDNTFGSVYLTIAP